MQVNYEGEEYELDLDEMDVKQARIIKVATGLTPLQLQRGMMEVDPDALTGLYWYMMVSNGKPCNIKVINFKVAKFSNALADALINGLSDDERAELEEETGVTLKVGDEPPKE